MYYWYQGFRLTFLTTVQKKCSPNIICAEIGEKCKFSHSHSKHLLCMLNATSLCCRFPVINFALHPLDQCLCDSPVHAGFDRLIVVFLSRNFPKSESPQPGTLSACKWRPVSHHFLFLFLQTVNISVCSLLKIKIATSAIFTPLGVWIIINRKLWI